MSTTHLEEVESTVVDPVTCWRFEALLRAGYDAGTALIVAGHPEVDLHAATNLLERGCPVELAARIIL